MDIQAVEQIVAKPVPLFSKGKQNAKDYKTLVTATKAFVVQDKKERQLDKLLKVAEKPLLRSKPRLPK